MTDELADEDGSQSYYDDNNDQEPSQSESPIVSSAKGELHVNRQASKPESRSSVRYSASHLFAKRQPSGSAAMYAKMQLESAAVNEISDSSPVVGSPLSASADQEVEELSDA